MKIKEIILPTSNSFGILTDVKDTSYYLWFYFQSVIFGSNNSECVK